MKDTTNNILVTILAFLLIVFLVAFIFNNGVNSHFTLDYILNLIANYEPKLPVTGFPDIGIPGNWGIFEIFRSSLNAFVTFFNIVVFFAANAVNVLFFLLYFVNAMFFVV